MEGGCCLAVDFGGGGCHFGGGRVLLVGVDGGDLSESFRRGWLLRFENVVCAMRLLGVRESCTG